MAYILTQVNKMIQVKSSGNVVLVLAAIIIILGAFKVASVIVVPVLLASFIAIIISPIYGWLISKNIPAVFALLAVISGLVIIVSIAGVIIGTSVQGFSDNLPLYEVQMEHQLNSLTAILQKHGIINGELGSLFNPSALIKYSATVLKGAGSILTNSFMIVLIIAFMLLESTHFSKKLELSKGHNNAMVQVNEVLTKIKHYMAIKAVVSLVTGLLISGFLFLMGLDYAILWGFIVFLLNFIPNIGSILAAVPAVLLAFVQLGPVGALEIGTIYLLINIVIGSIIEPRLMGQGLGLSTLVVFLSLIFWGWLLGPVGMLLSIPLTIAIKIMLYSQDQTRWIAVLMSNTH